MSLEDERLDVKARLEILRRKLEADGQYVGANSASLALDHIRALESGAVLGEVMDPNFKPTHEDICALRRDYAASKCEGLDVTVHLAPAVMYLNWTNRDYDPKKPGSQPGRCISFSIPNL